MSLTEAVLDVVNVMESEAQAMPGRDSDPRLALFAKMLRATVKAAESQPAFPPGAHFFPDPISQREYHVGLERAKLQKERGKFEDDGDPSSGVMREVVDGPLKDSDTKAPTYVSTPPGGNAGERSVIGSYVYRLDHDGKLYYCPQATQELRDSKNKVQEGG